MKSIRRFPSREELRAMKLREVIRCASERFGKFGYDTVSLDDIAGDLGVTKAALYNYASNKKDLLLQCFQMVTEDLITALEQAGQQEGTGAARLHRALLAYVLIMTRRDAQYLWTYNKQMFTEGRGPIVQEQRDKVDRLIRRFLLDGKEDGSLRADLEPKLASLVLLGTVNWMGIWYRQNGPLSAEDLGEKIISEAMRGYLT